MKKKRKKVSKKHKKFFILLSCYIAVFLITAIVTSTTLSWFAGSNWSNNAVYMGGPVYIYFSNNTGTEQTSGAGQLVTKLPPNWDRLYPGMNINFESTAVIQGAHFQKPLPSGDTVEYNMTGAILRAKVLLKVTAPDGTENAELLTSDIYDWIWPQIRTNASDTLCSVIDKGDTHYTFDKGKWVFDYLRADPEEENYFYFVKDNQSFAETGDYELYEVGGLANNVAVEFLNDTVVTLPGVPLTNEHSECTITFTIVFHALQAFLPYEQIDIDNNEIYQGDNSGRLVNQDDLGLAKPLTIKNSRRVFEEAFTPIYTVTPSPSI